MSILFFLVIIVCVVSVLVNCLQYIHILQLESYQNKMYLKWVIKNYTTPLGITEILVCFGGFTLTYVLASKFNLYGIALMLVLGICILWAGFSGYRFWKLPKKKPLVFTDRVRRLNYALFFALFAAYVILSFFTPYVQIMFLIILGLSPLLVLFANIIMIPVEKGIKRGFLSEAKLILRQRPDLIKIGITGSFGKTSSKFILQKILSEKYNTLASPASYNTPMGLTIVIREQLKPEHEVFIAEMGARYTKDIKELTDLVQPKYGLITSIGKQHLETFGSFENVAQTKYNLIDALPSDGIGYLPNDDGEALRRFQLEDKKKRLFSIEKADGAFVYAQNITVHSGGCEFDLVCELGTVRLNTVLLGKHNVLNILGACAVALDLGLSLEQIQAGVSKIEPIEHRLQLIASPSGVTVIDDAFNANPAGTKMALDVLQYFPGKKIIVTPGLVELGDEEQILNIQFGKDIAKSCDIAVIVGKRFLPYIKQGLQEENFDMGAIVEYESLDEVTAFIGAYAKPGDVVLFENDLPDNYL